MQALAFWKTVTVDRSNLLEQFLSLLERYHVEFCLIGGQAVNAYVEPVVSLDPDIDRSSNAPPGTMSWACNYRWRASKTSFRERYGLRWIQHVAAASARKISRTSRGSSKRLPTFARQCQPTFSASCSESGPAHPALG